MTVTHKELAEKIKKALGGVPCMEARPFFGQFVKDEATSVMLRYEWIRDGRIYDWIMAQKGVDMRDGDEWVEIFIEK